MPTEVPAPGDAELTTDSAVKLRPILHILEPTERELAHPPKPSLPTTRWTSDADFRAWCEPRDERNEAYNLASELRGIVEVGTLRGTDRTVYATFRNESGTQGMRDLTTNARGYYDIQLVAGPFDVYLRGFIRAVPVAQPTDQHGLAGFCATAEVLDWSIVKFDKGYRGRRLQKSHSRISDALWETDTWGP